MLAFGGAGGGFLALAASGPADTLTLRSNEGLVYDDQAGQVVARGDVVITYRDYTLKAQEMRYDLRTHRMDLSGGAWLQQGDRRIQAESLTFQLDDESGRFFNFAGQVAAKGVKGPVYIRGRQLQILPKAETLQDASFTTCDLEHPHYHVQARKVIIYPDDRLEAWSVVYYQGKIPLLYWPYLVIPLRRDNRLGLPQVGYSERDGWYIRNTYNYYTHSGASGSLVLDYFQKAGWGGGARHNFRLGGDGPWSGQGTLYGYARQTGVSPLLDWQLEGSYDQGLGSQGSLKLALGRSQQQTGPGSAAQKDSQRLNLSWQGNPFRLSWTWDGQASASVATGSGTGGASAAGDTGTSLPAWAQGRSVTSQLQAQWQPWAGGKLLLDAGYQQRDGFDSPALWRLSYRVAVQQEWPGQTWELLREEVIQPLPGEEEVPWTSYAREPELRWTLRPV
ncbi:MAG: LPS-assembly protein LptD, partial [Firmicutes bacterium]|nr:LPS-assembly protein LptD [Bacillota bacterium]